MYTLIKLSYAIKAARTRREKHPGKEAKPPWFPNLGCIRWSSCLMPLRPPEHAGNYFMLIWRDMLCRSMGCRCMRRKYGWQHQVQGKEHEYGEW